MASLTPAPEDEEQLRREQLGVLAAPPGGSPRMGSPFAGRGGPTAPGAQRGGAGYVGIDKYAAANQDATQALGGKVVGGVEQAGADARTALGSAQGAFNSASEAGTTRDNIHLRNLLSSDPVGVTGNAGQTGELTRMRDATYGGPRALEDVAEYGSFATAQNTANQTRELAGSEQGIAQLSDKAVSGTRTQGGRALDTQLLLGDPSLRGRVDTARAGIEALGTEAAGASKAAGETAKANEATTQGTREATRGSLTSSQQALAKALDDKVALQRYYANVRLNEAKAALAPQTSPIPTAGGQGRYYANNDPTQPQFTDGKIAGNVPEFIHNVGGQGLIPMFDPYLAQQNYAAHTPAATMPRALQDLGITPEQYSALVNLAPVGEMARASAFGTNNVNPFSFLEDYRGDVGDLSRFITSQDPEAAITRVNTASPEEYQRALALQQLAGDELNLGTLDAANLGQAGTSSADIVDFNSVQAQQARNAALSALAQRTDASIVGNARSGSDSFAKKYGPALAGQYVGGGQFGTAAGAYTAGSATASKVAQDEYEKRQAQGA